MNKSDIIQFLKEQGYYTESLHSIDEVQKEFKCSQEEAIKRIKESSSSSGTSHISPSSKTPEYKITDVNADFPLEYYHLNGEAEKGYELVSVVKLNRNLRYHFKKI